MTAGALTDQQREQREAATSADLLEHPGFQMVLKDVAREANVARGVILYGDAEDNVTKVERHRGSLAVLKSIVLAVYKRANKEVPANVAALFK